jgi:hypothetical protein
MTVAGAPGMSGSADGMGVDARFKGPQGIAIDRSGNVFIADSGNATIRKLVNGVVSTLAGSPGNPGTSDGPLTTARFAAPTAIAVDVHGTVYVADGHAIRRIANGTVTTLAGGTTCGFVDGVGPAAQFCQLSGIAIDGHGNLLVTDGYGCCVRRVTPDGSVSTLTLQFRDARGITFDDRGNAYIADEFGPQVFKLSTEGVITAIAGTRGAYGIVLGASPGFGSPSAIAVSGDALVIVDGNAVLRLHHGAQ